MRHVDRPLRKPVNLLLPQELVQEARRHTANLSDTVERLLQDFVEKQRAQDAARQARMDESIDMFNAHYEQHGLIGEDFLPV